MDTPVRSAPEHTEKHPGYQQYQQAHGRGRAPRSHPGGLRRPPARAGKVHPALDQRERVAGFLGLEEEDDSCPGGSAGRHRAVSRPRIRSLKPEALQHRKVGRLSDRSFRLWLGLITQADDEGRMIWDPAQFRLLVFGYQEITTENVTVA